MQKPTVEGRKVMPSPVFLCTSAEVVERKGDGLRFRTQMTCTESVKVYEPRSQECSEGELEGQPGGGA
jgi:hypothetical protein